MLSAKEKSFGVMWQEAHYNFYDFFNIKPRNESPSLTYYKIKTWEQKCSRVLVSAVA